MYTASETIYMRCVSPLHAGVGTDLGVVDMPIQRERHTKLPKVESSGVKGCFRDALERKKTDDNLDLVKVIFGPEKSGDEHAGSVCFTDARLLLFPVRSAKGIFAYATCPYVILRYIEDSNIQTTWSNIKANTVSGKGLLVGNAGKAVLEEYAFTVEGNEDTKNLAEHLCRCLKLSDERSELLKNNLIVLSDDDFIDFTVHNTEIMTRIRIDNETGTVASGGLFTEEFLPAESVLYNLCMASSIFLPADKRENCQLLREFNEDKNNGKSEGAFILEKLLSLTPDVIQLGGDATLGKGIVKVTWGGVGDDSCEG